MKQNKLTLEDFTKKAIDKYNNRKMVIDIEIESMGGTLTFTRPTENELLEYTNRNANAVETKLNAEGKNEVDKLDMIEMADAAKKLLYSSCSFLRDSELQKSLEVKDPYDVVTRVFGFDVAIDLAGKVIEAFSDNKVAETIKN